MNEVLEVDIHCPYCDERITVLVDGSVSEQTYVEDCKVCCRPILLDVAVGTNGHAAVHATPENS